MLHRSLFAQLLSWIILALSFIHLVYTRCDNFNNQNLTNHLAHEKKCQNDINVKEMIENQACFCINGDINDEDYS